MASVYRKTSRAVKKATRRRGRKSEIEEWRRKWRERGPVRFAEEVLVCPKNVPPHPDLGKIPDFVILSENQKEFLTDLFNGLRLFVLIAARGSGKTFALAVYITWRICCFNDYDINSYGGSQTQSMIIKDYVDYWRVNVKNIGYCIYRSIGGVATAPHCESRWNSVARFPPCSEASSRGPHVRVVIIDEAATAEAKSEEGRKAVRAVRFQLTGSADTQFGMTSTANYIYGSLYQTWTNYKKLGFKRYRWSIARHINGEKRWTVIDNVTYKDKNPKNWLPNVWWVTKDDIQDLRGMSTDDEWLVEALGGISIGSGLVYKRDDLKDAICDLCEVCNPYIKGECKLFEKYDIGDGLEHISNRKAGVDFGTVAPTALTVVGRLGKIIFVLYSNEYVGLGENEILDVIDKWCKLFSVFEIYADPEERAMRWALENMGYSMPELWAFGGGQKKNLFVSNSRRHMEHKQVVIPKKFVHLVRSMTQLSYDNSGKVRKHDDHSHDSFIYAISDYDVEERLEEFWSIKDRDIGRIW